MGTNLNATALLELMQQGAKVRCDYELLNRNRNARFRTMLIHPNGEKQPIQFSCVNSLLKRGLLDELCWIGGRRDYSLKENTHGT